MSEFPMRINKYLAVKGFSTRRGADALIERGVVFINGARAKLGDKVGEKDAVDVKEKQKAYRYFAYNKPEGVITHSPQYGEEDIARAVNIPNIFPVGRLDKRSSGLILLTDDARVTDKLLNPAHAHEKEYIVTTAEKLPSNFKRRMEKGVVIEGYKTKPCTVQILGEKKFSITLTEGKKHQIRRMCAALGLAAHDLKRTRIMHIVLGNLPKGKTRQIEGQELKTLLLDLGL